MPLTETKRSRLVTLLSHTLLIVIIFILPDLMLGLAMPRRWGFAAYPMIYLKATLYITLFYINYLYLIDRTLCRQGAPRRIGRFVMWNFILLIAALALSYIISNQWFPAPRPRHHRPENYLFWRSILRSASFLFRDAVMICLTIGLAVALRLSARWKDIREEQQELLAAQRTSELQNLKGQLNPHFLFNSLNTIYALIEVDGKVAQDAVHRLSTMLRYVLYDEQGLAELKREADFIENYVSMMKLRMGKRPVELTIDVGAETDKRIPALLFIPLVENAFKYGSKTSDNKPIVISIFAKDNTLVCDTSNTFVPDSSSKESSGIGLANLRRRLTLFYGQEAKLTVKVEGNVFSTHLSVPLDVTPKITTQ